MNDLKRIILCADDFGLNASVSRGILKLAQLKRLSAVSCMVNQPDFTAFSEDLLALHGDIQIGLHFNLTEGCLLSSSHTPCYGLNELLLKTHLGLINVSLITNEFNAQLERFIHIMGRLPDFIDGHQHVHQFPGIRAIILEIFEARLKTNGTYIRSTYPVLGLPQYRLKSKILSCAGGRTLQTQLDTRGIARNSYFSGIYDFHIKADYAVLFNQWLALACPNTLIMCHPGEPEETLSTDAIAQARAKELNYFLSDAFILDCVAHKVHLQTGFHS